MAQPRTEPGALAPARPAARRRPLTGDALLKYVLVAPAMILLLGTVIYPFIYTLQTSVFRWDMGVFREFVGLKYYAELFGNEGFYNSFKNTWFLVIAAVGLEFVLGLAIALLLNHEIGRVRSLFRALLLIPMFTAPVVTGIVWRMLLNPQFGPVQWALGVRGWAPTGTTEWALWTVVWADVWQWTPFMFIIFLAALQMVPLDLIDAAKADGANAWQRLRYITLPQISYALVIATLLRLMDALKIFDVIYTLTQGGPGRDSEDATFLIFRWAFNDLRISLAAAYSWVMVIVISIIVTIFINQVQKRYRLL